MFSGRNQAATHGHSQTLSRQPTVSEGMESHVTNRTFLKSDPKTPSEIWDITPALQIGTCERAVKTFCSNLLSNGQVLLGPERDMSGGSCSSLTLNKPAFDIHFFFKKTSRVTYEKQTKRHTLQFVPSPRFSGNPVPLGLKQRRLFRQSLSHPPEAICAVWCVDIVAGVASWGWSLDKGQTTVPREACKRDK